MDKHELDWTRCQVVVLKHSLKFFDIPPIEGQSLYFLPLNLGGLVTSSTNRIV